MEPTTAHLAFVGLPWAAGARGPRKYGCAGLVEAYLHSLGMDPPAFPSPELGGEVGAAEDYLAAFAERWYLLGGRASCAKRRGDVAACDPERMGGASHVAVLAVPAERLWLTSFKGMGSRLIEEPRLKRVVAVWRLRA